LTYFAFLSVLKMKCYIRLITPGTNISKFFAHKFCTMLKRLTRNKHFGLFCLFVSDEDEMLHYIDDTRANISNLFCSQMLGKPGEGLPGTNTLANLAFH
jgi:hypothetical protein